MLMTRKEISELLHASVRTVTFTKTNGEERVMRCTLMESALPPANPDAAPHKVNDEVLAVWDVEKEGWRSFRLDSVTQVE